MGSWGWARGLLRAVGQGPALSCPPPSAWPPSLLAFLSTLLELAAYALLLYWSVQHFGLEIDWEKKVLESKVGTSRPHWVAVPVPVPTAWLLPRVPPPALTPRCPPAPAFTYHEFTQWLRTVTLPLVGVGFLSLSWEILSALYR